MDTVISRASRPTSSQCRSSTLRLWAITSGVDQTFHSSAYRAAMRIVRRSPPPPTSSGNLSCTGLGLFGASVIR